MSEDRPLLNLSPGQAGDTAIGDVAGADVRKPRGISGGRVDAEGAVFGQVEGGASINDPAPWLAFFRSYLHDLDQQRTQRDEVLAHEITEARKALSRLASDFADYQRFVSDRFTADAEYRRVTRLLATAALVIAVIALGIAVL